MSRVGYEVIPVPSSVTLDISDDKVTVRGAKGELVVDILSGMKIKQDDENIQVERADDGRETRSRHGLQRTLLANAVTGVSEGFSKVLQVEGVGFKVDVSGNKVVLNLGYSHPQELSLPEGVEASNEGNTLTISGIDKQLVGQVASEIRALRPPEPYKGKGVRYDDERIIRKAGKAAGAGK